MKILELQLLAFGPFTELSLDLAAGERGLHVVFGPNEAGKSSALRAVKAFLYGIPSITPDRFKHGYDKLRIGGRLRHSDGTELTFIRRKGIKNTLLDPNGRPIADSALDKFLAGVGEDLFSTMFGIDHATLVQGGQEILQGGGEVGQSLFAAGMGIVRLRQILQALDSEAGQLFLPQGRNPKVNKAIADFAAANHTIAEYSRLPSEWANHEQALKKAEAEAQQVIEELDRRAKEKSRYERLQMALPKIAKRKELLAKLQALAGVVRLPPEFPEERREAERKRQQARETERVNDLALQQLRQGLQALSVPEALLEQADTITALRERLGIHRKAAQDRSNLDGNRQQLLNDSVALLPELPTIETLEQAKKLRPDAAYRARIQELGAQYQARVEATERATRDVQKIEEQLARKLEELNALPPLRDARDLRRALGKAPQQGVLEEACEQARTELQAEEEQALIELKQLGLWSGTLEELPLLLLPSGETLERFEAEFGKLDASKIHLDEQIKAFQAELGDLVQELDRLRLAGAVPSEDELHEARVRRDQLWEFVRRAWIGREDVFEEMQASDAGADLPEAYERSARRADEIADRLRREADRVAKQANLVAQQAKCAKDVEQLARDMAILQDQLRQLHEAWVSLWYAAGITPLPPREMRAWMDKRDRLLQRAEHVRDCRRNMNRLCERIDEQRTTLTRLLEELGEQGITPEETLDALLVRSESLIEMVAEAARQRKSLEGEVIELQLSLENARREQHEATSKLAQWRDDWTGAVVGLSLGSDALPVEAIAVLGKLDELLKKLDETEALRGRIEGIDRDARTFEADVRDIVARIAPDLLELPADQAAAQLNARLSKSQTDKAKKDGLSQQIEEKEADFQKARSTIRLMDEQLSTCCREAGCSHPDELPALEVRSAQAQELSKELDALDQQLLEVSGGATVDHFIREAEAVDADAVPVRLAEFTRRIEELESRRSQLDQTIGGERTFLDQMDGSARAAEAAEKAHAMLAEIREGVERYIRLRLASIILRREIEHYRAAHQGPLLSRAGELFTQLTLGSFAGLQSDFNDRDQPILVGVRASGTCVGVEGMSDGSRDQLFLALRLASLERYLDASEPLPFIVDDILIRFDDQRAEATLKVLAQLSAKTQVIFFTHHWRLVEIAQGLEGHGVEKIHQL